MSIQEIARGVEKCREPQKFKAILRKLYSCVPYKCLAYGWGYYQDYQIAFWGDVDYPKQYLNFYMEEGALRVDPLFRNWLETGKCQMLDELVKNKDCRKINIRYLKKTREAGLLHTIAAGTKEDTGTTFFAATFESEMECRNYIEIFTTCVPLLSLALRKAYSSKLTKKQHQALDLLSRGKRPRTIANQLKSTEIRVQAYLKEARKKLQADTNEHAIRIATATGLFSIPLTYSD